MLTAEGNLIHEHADNPFANDTRREVRITRSVHVVSKSIGLKGIVDVVEYARDDTCPKEETITLSGRRGMWKVIPVEYKRGRPKRDDIDAVQLCAQAICLEEMLNVKIEKGYLYYNNIKRRQPVMFDGGLRNHVIELSEKMHRMVIHGITPPAVRKKHCIRCSLYEICQPDWSISKKSVESYLSRNLVKDGVDLK